MLSRTLRRATQKAQKACAFVRYEHTQKSGGSGRTTSFGFQTVAEEDKETLVKGVFDSVASKYDLMNDSMSLGVHRLWKATFVDSLKPGRKAPLRCIDVAGGTGDIALALLDYAREHYADRDTSVDVVDINAQMLAEGQKRFRKTMYHNSTSTLILPLPSLTPSGAQLHKCCSARRTQKRSPVRSSRMRRTTCTRSHSGYATARPSPRSCARRIGSSSPVGRLRVSSLAGSGTRFCAREPPLLLARNVVLILAACRTCRLYDQYSFSVIPLLGTILTGDRASYQYLVESIRKFPSQPEFAQMIRDAGFVTGEDRDGGAWTDLWGGIVSIHKGVKI